MQNRYELVKVLTWERLAFVIPQTAVFLFDDLDVNKLKAWLGPGGWKSLLELQTYEEMHYL